MERGLQEIAGNAKANDNSAVQADERRHKREYLAEIMGNGLLAFNKNQMLLAAFTEFDGEDIIKINADAQATVFAASLGNLEDGDMRAALERFQRHVDHVIADHIKAGA